MKIHHNLKSLLIALTILFIFVYGYRYYEYTQNDPDFCTSCHLVREVYIDWQKSVHSSVICQKCHEIGIIEQNRKLISFVAKGEDPISLTHGRQRPWLKCIDCHQSTVFQGSVSPDKSFGHAKHALKEKIECKQCHYNERHNLPYDITSCDKCHHNKEVHGISVKEFSCVNCHPFLRRHPVMTPPDKCTKCHHEIPKKNSKSKLSCHYCHKPHKREKVTNLECLFCHKTEANLGQHGTHHKKGIECMHCHKPHKWNIEAKEKNKLCSECHNFKDPKTFIYIF
ncbi:MAG: NapC/NirT family cytochrome c [Thermodesulfovibrionales bacterium]|nr:NapC/NirT family cytochrome c [Thermodesulfovibrionales bacterium]